MTVVVKSVWFLCKFFFHLANFRDLITLAEMIVAMAKMRRVF